MKILLLGYSSIAKKRIINTFKKKNIDFCVASKSTKNKINGAYDQFKNYKEALNKSNAQIAYISLPNSLHYIWAKFALIKGFHVIVDKPICINLNQTKKLIRIAKKNKKLLVEAIYFNFHKQFLRSIKLSGGIDNISHIESNFVIPTPKKNNYRSIKKLGGGALLDMGPYAAAISRIFFKNCNSKVKALLEKNRSKIITSFKISAKSSTKTFSGLFKFGGDYQNELCLYSKKKIVKITRVFSPPDNISLPINVLTSNFKKTYVIKKDNCFENFLLNVLNNIKKKKYNHYIKEILTDVNYRDKINK
tara:strand:+ start:1034 stop:1948 length:915 start_codon:yes stop_codon:yes gene_type:complete